MTGSQIVAQGLPLPGQGDRFKGFRLRPALRRGGRHDRATPGAKQNVRLPDHCGPGADVKKLARGYLGRVAMSWRNATSRLPGLLNRSSTCPFFASGGVVRLSTHFRISECPSAKEKLLPRL